LLSEEGSDGELQEYHPLFEDLSTRDAMTEEGGQGSPPAIIVADFMLNRHANNDDEQDSERIVDETVSVSFPGAVLGARARPRHSMFQKQQCPQMIWRMTPTSCGVCKQRKLQRLPQDLHER
jgi:hypothetical protein